MFCASDRLEDGNVWREILSSSGYMRRVRRRWIYLPPIPYAAPVEIELEYHHPDNDGLYFYRPLCDSADLPELVDIRDCTPIASE